MLNYHYMYFMYKKVMHVMKKQIYISISNENIIEFSTLSL